MPTQISKSIKADGTGDYTTITAGFAAVTANLVTADENWTFTINDNSTYTENPTLDRVTGSASDATRSVKLTVGAGNTPVLVVGSGTAIGINFSVNGGMIDGLKISCAAGKTGSRFGGLDCTVQLCEVYGSGTNTGTGLDMRGTTNAHHVKRCKLYNLVGAITDGIAADNSTIQNCVIYNCSSYGINLVSGSNGFAIYHNTIDIDVAAANCLLFLNTSTPVNTIKNNIFKAVNGYCLNGGATASLAGITSDNNRFQVSGTGFVGQFNSTNYQTLANWQAASGSPDPNSVEGAPSWTNEAGADYTLTTADLGEAGLGVTVDYNGVTRGSPPDRGAFEFTPPVASGKRKGIRDFVVSRVADGVG